MSLMVHRRVAVFAFAAAVVAFCVVQDRGTAAGARQYVTLQRAALAGGGPAVTVDEVMVPAVRQSVRDGLLWGGAVGAVGLAAAAAAARRTRRG